MAIEIDTPQGIIEFPDGTPEETINRVLSGQFKPQEPTKGSFADPLGQGITLGFSDELAGAIGAPVAWLKGDVPRTMEGFTGAYTGIRDAARQQQADFSQRNPGTALGLELAGGMMTGGLGAKKALATQAPKWAQYAKTAGTSAAGGALYGAGTGEGLEGTIEGAKTGAMTGAVMGPLAKGVADKGAKMFAERASRKALNSATSTIDEVKDRAHALYAQADEIGMVFKPEKLRTLTAKIYNDVRAKGFDKDLQPGINRVIERFIEEVDAGQPVTLEKLDILRQVANGAFGNNPKQNMMVSMITDKIDDFAMSLKPKDLVAGSPQAAKVIEQARKMWSIKSKHDILEEAMRKAESQASGVENGIRTQFRHILNSKKSFRKFNLSEQQMIKDVVDGKFSHNTLRGLGRFAPVDGITSHWLSSLMGAGGGYMAGGPAGAVAVPLIGQAAQYASRRATQGRAQDAINQVLRGAGPNIHQAARPMMSRVQRVTDPLAAALGMQGLMQ